MFYHGHQFHPADKDLELFFVGCSLKCPGCHNPELQNRTEDIIQKTPIEIYKEIHPYLIITKRVLLMGGEPQEQNINELIELCKLINSHNVNIILFTGYDILIDNRIKNYVSSIKFGKYDISQQCDDNIQNGIKLASKNQHIEEIL